jgi:hypothetical protein
MRARWRAALYRHFVVVGILSAGLVVAAVGLDLATPASADPGTVVAQNQGPFTYLFDGPTISKPAGTLQAGVTDSDPNQSGSCCTASLDTPPPSGSVTVRPDGSFTYVPGVGFLGSESFTFILTDSDGNASLPATMTLTDGPFPGQAPQTLDITSTPDNPYVRGPSYQVVTQSNAGLSSYVQVYGTESVCSAFSTGVGWALSFTAPGTCTILAVNYGTADWAPVQAEQSFTVKAAQSVTFTSTAPSPPTVGTTYALAASASSGDPVTFSIDPGSAPICALSGTVVSFTETGDCLIFASTSGDKTYGPADAWVSLTVVGAPQTVAFSSIAPENGVVGGQTYTPVAAASSGLPITFVTYGFFSGTTIPVCYMSGSVLVFYAVGTCRIDAVQAGTDVYAPAAAEQTIAVVAPPVPTPQIISWPSKPTSGTLGSGATLSAVGGGSNNPIVFSIDAASGSGVCSAQGTNGTHLTYIGVGTCVVDANQAGNANHSPAPQVRDIFSVTVCGGSQSSCFTSAASTSVPVGSRLSFAVVTAGTPKPKITETGKLPKGLKFNQSSHILRGSPISTKHTSALGTYPLTFTATFGKGKSKVVVTQAFTLVVT